VYERSDIKYYECDPNGMGGDRNFDLWMSTFKESIADYTFYVDFPKIFSNVDSIKIELNILNSLVGSKNIESDFKTLVRKYPEILKCIPILIAVRLKEIVAIDGDGDFKYNFNKPNYPIEQFVIFMKKIGLFDLISNHIINNLVDYVMGVETGLDSNARKNRGGTAMENLVESYIKKTGCNYHKEMSITEIQSKWNIDLSRLSNDGKTVKRFDFVVESKSQIYGVEVNFYSGGGSKLNETARSYKMLAEESRNIEKFNFVWITDGIGWKQARGNLRETFDSLDNLYCIKDLENGVLKQIMS
jgi:type II restriction enzyme